MLSVVDIRDKLTEITDKLYNSENQDFYREKIAEFREIKKETLEDIKGFYIEDPLKQILPIVGEDIFLDPSYGFYPNDTMFKERFILPVWTVDKKVAGFIGYDNLSTFRYILSQTEGFTKKTTVYGLHNIDRIIEEDYLIIVEGHFDERRLYELGYPCIALQGTNYPDFLKRIVKPLKGVIHLLDKDAAGITALKYNKNIHPNSVIMHLPDGKDPDAYLKNKENQEEFKKAIKEIERYNFLIPVVSLADKNKHVK